jgi:hypothetical protein
MDTLQQWAQRQTEPVKPRRDPKTRVVYTDIAQLCAFARMTMHYDASTGEMARRLVGGKLKKVGNLNGDGYVVVKFNWRQFRLHRLAWLMVHGDWPKGEIDHINGRKADNRLHNLRDVPPALNQQNKWDASLRSTTGMRGVSKAGNKFKAQLSAEGRDIYLGLYDTVEQAHAAYLAGKAAHQPGAARL